MDRVTELEAKFNKIKERMEIELENYEYFIKDYTANYIAGKTTGNLGNLTWSPLSEHTVKRDIALWVLDILNEQPEEDKPTEKCPLCGKPAFLKPVERFPGTKYSYITFICKECAKRKVITVEAADNK